MYHIYLFLNIFFGLTAISPIINHQFATLWTIFNFVFDYNIFYKVKTQLPQVGGWLISKKSHKSITPNVQCTLTPIH